MRLLLAWALIGCAPASAAAQDVVTEIEVVPANVTVASDAQHPTRFVLEARLWTWLGNNRSGIPESSGVSVNWSVSPSDAGLHLVGDPHGYRAMLELDPGADLSETVKVKAEAGGIGADSYIVAANAGGDAISTSYTDDQFPDVVIVRGEKAGQPCSTWIAPALTRGGDLGDVQADCAGAGSSGVALLDPVHGMVMHEGKWTADIDKIDATADVPIRSIPLAVRVYLGGTDADLPVRQDTALAYALREIAYSDTAFRDSRAGIAFTVIDTRIVSAPPVSTAVYDCPGGDASTGGHDFVPPAAPASTPPILHVYVVDEMGKSDGLTCPATTRRLFPVIYLRRARSGTILVHELGHALGLDLPGAGHTDDMDQFDAANVMVGGWVLDKVWRRRFTVGQVLRMNVGAGSWLNWATDLAGNRLRDDSEPRAACQCGEHDPPGPCPRLVDDVANPRYSVGTLHSWDCSDVVRVASVETDDEPRALLAGRLWGSPPTVAGCRRNIPGRKLDIEGVSYVQATNPDGQPENLTAPGLCPSWVAIFYRHHRALITTLANAGGAWSDAADYRPLDTTLVDPRPVTVHVAHGPADAQAVKTAIAAAEPVFGADNRTGITLTLTPEQKPCPTTPQSGQLWVCYSSGAAVSLSQQVGKVLGLRDLGLAEEGEDAFTDNAFLTTRSAGNKLTLGQVFWIHAALKTPGFPDCAKDASECPPLDADVQP
jgi:hypothetical protein